MTTSHLLLTFFALLATLAQVAEFPTEQDENLSSDHSLSPSQMVQRALENEMLISNIQGRVDKTYTLGIPGIAGRSKWARILISFDGRYSFDGRDISGDEWIGVHDGTTVVRLYPTSNVVEIYPNSVLDRKPWDLSYEALGPIDLIQKAARPLHTINALMLDGQLAEIQFIVVEETDESVTLQETLKDSSDGPPFGVVSITLLPKKGFSLARFTMRWGQDSSTEFFEEHIKTEQGHWVPQRYWEEDSFFYLSPEVTKLSEVTLSELETNLDLDESHFDVASKTKGMIVVDYRTFKGWLFFWTSEYDFFEIPEASDSLHEAYPIVWFALILSIIFIPILVFVVLAFRVLRLRHSR